MRFRISILAAVLATLVSHSLEGGVPLATGPFKNIEVTRSPDGPMDLVVTGPSPHFWSAPVPKEFAPGKHTVLAFEYFSPSGVDDFSVRFRNPDENMVLVGSTELLLAEAWVPVSIDLSHAEITVAEGGKGQRFHFSFRAKPGEGLQLRGLSVREPTTEEIELRKDREAVLRKKEVDATAILEYFQHDFPGAIREVVIQAEWISIAGHSPEPALLREVRPVHESHRRIPDPPIVEDLKGDFSIRVKRYVIPGKRDRALSRWRLEKNSGEFLSACRWPDRIEEGLARNLPELKAEHQKGLGGIPVIGSPDHEIFELGIRHATVNVVLNSLLTDKPGRGREKIMFEGKPFFLNRGFLNQRLQTVRLLCQKGIIVTAILLVGNRDSDSMVHPEAESRGKFAMPNLQRPEGVHLYQAALHVLANHFTSPESRISNWVIHNEIDQAGTWTNMGDQPLARYLETYHRSARLVYHTMRLRDPHARVFISLTHHWTKQSSGSGTYKVRDMLEMFADMGRVEGDYEWGVAYHPYPRNLRDPNAWEDDGATMSFDTLYITPKNFEVLPFFLQQKRFRYDNKSRGILFSEQGFNSPTLSEEDQRRQVAGLIYLFRRLSLHPTVEAFHLHRYKDMPDKEGGLRLGIVDENGNRKLGWDAYREIGTAGQKRWDALADEVMAQEKD